LLLTQAANAVVITRNFTGHWDQPEQESQGIIFQVVQQPDGSKDGVVYWFTYNLEGEPLWLLGVGDVDRNALSVEMLQVSGPTFMQDASPGSRTLQSVGTMDLAFSDCNSGDVVFQPTEVVGTGGFNGGISQNGTMVASEFSVQRLTKVFNTSCSGGISDDTPAQTLPSIVAQFVANTGLDPDASVKIEFEEESDHSEFSVEIEDVPVGDYELYVDGELRAIITVVDDGAGGTEGEVEFRSPLDDDDELLLDFDPRDKLIEITMDGQVYFSGLFDGTSTPDDDGDDDAGDDDRNNDDGSNEDPSSVGAPEFGDMETKIELSNTGVNSAISGDAELKQDPDKVEFEVEIEDTAPGIYELWLGGDFLADIEVIDFGFETEGEVEFRFPQENDHLLLNFDPRGQLIEIIKDGDVLLNGMFPQ
jgi:hypothetical protein